MNGNIQRPKRRSTRCRTILIDTTEISGTDQDKDRDMSTYCNNSQNEGEPKTSAERLNNEFRENLKVEHLYKDIRTHPMSNNVNYLNGEVNLKSKIESYSKQSYNKLSEERNCEIDLHSRTFAFEELMSAFKQIEKRDNQDKIDGILKKFKSNDEKEVILGENDSYKFEIKDQIFPKIQNNPFLSSNISKQNVETENIDKDNTNSSRRSKRVSFDTNLLNK